jgi:transposase
VRDLSAGDTRIYLEIESRRVRCRSCAKVKQEKLAWLSDNPFYTKRFAFFVGRRCRAATIRDTARDLHLDWKTVKEFDKEYMQEQLRRAATPAPRAVGIDEGFDPQGAHLSHCGERLGAASPDLVRRPGPL